MKLKVAAPGTNGLANELGRRIELRTARVVVVGLGYVGLPLAETFAWGGFPVLGFDIDDDKVTKLLRGESYIGHICSERVAELVGSGRFDATSDPGRFVEADAISSFACRRRSARLASRTSLTSSRQPR
jgi:UDP-N-acetyl-D-glucosamine dehydrogenase